METKSSYKLKKGDKAPDFSLKGTDGKVHSLKDVKSNATLIVFMCNHCPYVIAKLDELNRINEDYKDKGLEVIGINSNDSTVYEEDSFENMQKLTKSGEIQYTYLIDETQEIAKAYGAVCTPDPFLFDKDKKLIFHAKVDDLHRAILEYLDSGNISIEEKPSMGCSVKWK